MALKKFTSNNSPMKTYLKSFLAFILISSITACSTETTDEPIKDISVNEFEELLTENSQPMILDVRTPEEFSEGHIEGAMLTNFLGEDFQKQLEVLDKSKTYVVYCKSGIRQAKAATLMKESGFKHVYLLEGGIDNWMKEGKPTKK